MAMDTFKKSIGNWNASISDIVEGLDSQGIETVSDEELEGKVDETVTGNSVLSEDEEELQELERELDNDLEQELTSDITDNDITEKEEDKEEDVKKEDIVEEEEEEKVPQVNMEHKDDDSEIEAIDREADFKDLGYGLEQVEDLDKEDELAEEADLDKDKSIDMKEEVKEEITQVKADSNDVNIYDEALETITEINIDTTLVVDNHNIQITTFNPPVSLDIVTGVCNFNPSDFRSKDIRETDLNCNITKVEDCDVIDLGANKLLLSKSFYNEETVSEYFNKIADTLKLGRNFKCDLVSVSENGYLYSKLSALELSSLYKSFEKVVFKVFVINNQEQEQSKLCLSVKLA